MNGWGPCKYPPPELDNYTTNLLRLFSASRHAILYNVMSGTPYGIDEARVERIALARGIACDQDFWEHFGFIVEAWCERARRERD